MGISLILDEIEFAREIKAGNKDFLGIDGVTKYLTKLYKHDLEANNKELVKQGEKPKELKTEDIIEYVMDYLVKKDNKFDCVENYDTIRTIVNKYSKETSPIVKSDGVKITSKELKAISKANNKHLEILAFCMLVLRKVDNIKYGVQDNVFNHQLSEYYYNLTGERRNNFKQNKAIGKLIELELLSMPNIKDWGKTSSVILNFIDFEEEDVVFVIDDFREVALEYLRWKGEKVGKCEECGRLIEITSNKIKYCRDCWTTYRKKYKAEKERKRRKKMKRGHLEKPQNP